MKRRCGDCTLCCKLLPVRELAKAANRRCVHQRATGCRVYHGAGFPVACGVWSCRWLTHDATASLGRPDRAGYVIDAMPDFVRWTNRETGRESELLCLQVWCDPARPAAWRDPGLLRYIETEGLGMLVRLRPDWSVFACPPRFANDHEWHFVELGAEHLMATESGSLFVDRLRERGTVVVA